MLLGIAALLLGIDLVDYLLEKKILVSLGRVEFHTLGVALAGPALDKGCQEWVRQLLFLGLDCRGWRAGGVLSLGGFELVLSPVF